MDTCEAVNYPTSYMLNFDERGCNHLSKGYDYEVNNIARDVIIIVSLL